MEAFWNAAAFVVEPNCTWSALMVTSPDSEFDADPPIKFVLLEVSLSRTCFEPPSSVMAPPAAKISVQLRVIEFEPVPELGEPTSEMSQPPVAVMVVLAVVEPDHATIPRPVVEVPFDRPVMLIAVPVVLADVIVVLKLPSQLSSIP